MSPSRPEDPRPPQSDGTGASLSEDARLLQKMGYAQELWRRMSGFSNFAISFSIIYAIMNVGYLAAGYIFDYFRSLDVHTQIGGLNLTPHQQLFAVSLGFEIVLFPVMYFLRRKEEGPEKQTIRAPGMLTTLSAGGSALRSSCMIAAPRIAPCCSARSSSTR